MTVSIDQWADEPEFKSDVDLSFSVQYSPYLPWYKRLGRAIDYIFTGYGSYWYSATLVREEDVKRLKAIIKDYETRIKDLK